MIAKKLKEQGKDSAHNSDEDEEMRDAREQKQEQLINYNFLGSEECPIDPEAEEIEYSMIWRIARIEKLEPCKHLRVSAPAG